MRTRTFPENTFSFRNYKAERFLKALMDFLYLVDLKNARRRNPLYKPQVDSNLNLILPGAGKTRNPPSSEPELLGFEILSAPSVPPPWI